jgi:iron complex outermembrane recepter protein
LNFFSSRVYHFTGLCIILTFRENRRKGAIRYILKTLFLYKPTLYLVLLLFISDSVLSQNKISGKIVDSTQTPVAYIAVALLNGGDSSIVKGVNTDEKGNFEFRDLKKGNYQVRISAIGFNDHFSSSFVLDSLSVIEMPLIQLQSGGVDLKEVSVSVLRKPIEFKGGNIIVNIDGSPLAVGNSVYDLLSRLPGVQVQDDNISINGTQGVRVMIDERVQQLSGSQLVSLLKSIPGTAVDKIEILKIPPVKYDAGGGAGMINIITKKVKITGTSGSAYVNYSQGFYARSGAGFSLNHKGKKLALFSGFNINYNPTRYDNIFERHIPHDSIITHIYQVNYNKTVDTTFSYYIGGDWYLNKKNIVGFKFESGPGFTSATRQGTISLVNNDLGYDKLPYYSKTRINWEEYSSNLNFEHSFDTLGTKLKFVADQFNTKSHTRSLNDNRFMNLSDSTVIPDFIYTNKNDASVFVLSSKLDFETKFSKTLSFETGIKYSYQDMFSGFELRQRDPATGVFERDTVFTNEFAYNEQIEAGYMNFRKEVKKFSFGIGLRVENTEVRAESITKGTKFYRQFFGFFPLLSIDYNRSDKHNFSLSYNRRVERPNYNSYNPFRWFFSNILVSNQGNPYLRPQYNNMFNLSHSYKGAITNSLHYNFIENDIMGYSLQNDSAKQTIWTNTNFNRFQIFAYNLNTYFDLYKWWNLTFNAWVNYFDYDGQLNGSLYKAGSFNYGLWMSNQLSLPSDLKLEVSAFYLGPWLGAIYQSQPRGALNLGLRRTFYKGRWEASIGAYDIFNTLRVHNKVKFQDQDYFTRDIADTRRFNLGLTYNFGKIKVNQRERSAGEEERRRMGK